MKKFLLMMLVITMTLTVIGCTPNDRNANQEPTNQELFDGGLECISTSKHIYYYRDIVTDVMYVRCYSSGLTEMSDPETGLPLTYTRYLELQNNNGGSSK